MPPTSNVHLEQLSELRSPGALSPQDLEQAKARRGLLQWPANHDHPSGVLGETADALRDFATDALGSLYVDLRCCTTVLPVAHLN